jgi:hypothetical protein
MDAFWQWVANMLPRNLVYWSAIRLIAHATMGRWSDEQVTEVTAVAALRRWDEEGRTAQNPPNLAVRGFFRRVVHPGTRCNVQTSARARGNNL